ncbi:MAG: gamma-glutamylcyclotransferase family protein [Psychrilyobacter sp.]|uniref:gamma-glutamylcyclotransferase family protein n=1 Tax=Psychrilyobacter sp. TaxID=2586924 RepID=UPI003C75A619
MKIKRIFVYGSLKEGFYNYNKFLKNKTINKISGVYILGELFHLPNKGYPAAISGEETIIGEVLDILDDGKIFDEIHRMEGFISYKNPNNEYNLEMKEVIFPNNKKELLPVYIYNSTKKEIIDNDLGVCILSGDWSIYMSNKNNNM